MANSGPSWTDNVAVQAPYGLLKGATPLRTTLDLRAKFGAFLKIAVGRYSTAALNVGCDVIVQTRVEQRRRRASLRRSLVSSHDGHELRIPVDQQRQPLRGRRPVDRLGRPGRHGLCPQRPLVFLGARRHRRERDAARFQRSAFLLLGSQRRSAAVFGGGDPACYRQRHEIRTSGQRSVFLGGFMASLAARRFDVLFDLRPRRRHDGQRRVPVHGRHADV